MSSLGVRRANAAFLGVFHPATLLQPEAIGGVMEK